jgi:hypothetical protein
MPFHDLKNGGFSSSGSFIILGSQFRPEEGKVNQSLFLSTIISIGILMIPLKSSPDS